MPTSDSLIQQAEKLWEFFNKDPAGKLFFDSLSGYGLIALTAISPPLGAAGTVSLILAQADLTKASSALDFLQAFVEVGISKRFGIIGDLSVIKAKQIWQLADMAGITKTYSSFIKESIFQSSYTAFKKLGHTHYSFAEYFDKDVFPSIHTYFQQAIKRYIENVYKPDLVQIVPAFNPQEIQNSINSMLSQKTIMSLDLNLSIDYPNLLTKETLIRFDDYVENTIKKGIDKFQEIVDDDTLAHIDYENGQYFVGKINPQGLPHGKGTFFTETSLEQGKWENGLKLNKPSTQLGASMIQTTAALVSIASGLYGIKSNYEQTKHLESIHNFMENLLKATQMLPGHIARQFDEQTMREAYNKAISAIESLHGLREFKNINTIENAFYSSRSKALEALNFFKMSPSGNDKLVFSPVVGECANALSIIVILEFLSLGNERRETMSKTLMENIIIPINQYINGVENAINSRFSHIDVQIKKKGPAYLGGPGRRDIFAFYHLDGQIIKVLDFIKEGGADKDYYWGILNEAVEKRKKELREAVQPSIDALKTVLSKCSIFLIEHSFQEILSRECGKGKTGTEWWDYWQSQLITKGLQEMRREIGMGSEGRDRVGTAFQEILGHQDFSRAGQREEYWTRKLSDDGYQSLSSEVAKLPESRNRITEILTGENFDINYWVEQVANIGFNSAFSDFFRKRANENLKLKNYQIAINNYIKLIRLEPNNPLNFYSLGICKFYLGKYTDAITHYNEALHCNPDSVLQEKIESEKAKSQQVLLDKGMESVVETMHILDEIEVVQVMDEKAYDVLKRDYSNLQIEYSKIHKENKEKAEEKNKKSKDSHHVKKSISYQGDNIIKKYCADPDIDIKKLKDILGKTKVKELSHILNGEPINERPLHLAIQAERSDVVQLLLEYDARIDEKETNILVSECKNKVKVREIKALLNFYQQMQDMGDSVGRTLTLIFESAQALEWCQGENLENAIIFIADTGRGKSTLTSFTLGVMYTIMKKSTGEKYLVPIGQEMAKSSQKSESKTSYPEIFKKDNLVVGDMQGFRDTRGESWNIASGFGTHMLGKCLKTIKTLAFICLDSDLFGSSKIDIIKEPLIMLGKIVKENPELLKNLRFILNKAHSDRIEIGRSAVMAKFNEILDENPTLEEPAKFILQNIVEEQIMLIDAPITKEIQDSLLQFLSTPTARRFTDFNFSTFHKEGEKFKKLLTKLLEYKDNVDTRIWELKVAIALRQRELISNALRSLKEQYPQEQKETSGLLGEQTTFYQSLEKFIHEFTDYINEYYKQNPGIEDIYSGNSLDFFAQEVEKYKVADRFWKKINPIVSEIGIKYEKNTKCPDEGVESATETCTGFAEAAELILEKPWWEEEAIDGASPSSVEIEVLEDSEAEEILVTSSASSSTATPFWAKPLRLISDAMTASLDGMKTVGSEITNLSGKLWNTINDTVGAPNEPSPVIGSNSSRILPPEMSTLPDYSVSTQDTLTLLQIPAAILGKYRDRKREFTIAEKQQLQKFYDLFMSYHKQWEKSKAEISTIDQEFSSETQHIVKKLQSELIPAVRSGKGPNLLLERVEKLMEYLGKRMQTVTESMGLQCIKEDRSSGISFEQISRPENTVLQSVSRVGFWHSHRSIAGINSRLVDQPRITQALPAPEYK